MKPLLFAIVGALIGFGGWIWLTGPGASVMNALIALACAIALGRVFFWLALRFLPEAGAAAIEPPPLPPAAPSGRRAPPPSDPEPWRRPDRPD